MSVRWLYGIAAVFVLIAVYVFFRHYWRPYGHREAYLRNVDSALQNYAHDHGGWFPRGDDSGQALQSLYPDYLGSGVELAGLTGDTRAVVGALQRNQSISNLTSWIYVPNLKIDDDHRLALLWESKLGVTAAGRVTIRKTRPVLLVDQSITNVSEADWAVFLDNQRHMQKLARPEVREK